MEEFQLPDSLPGIGCKVVLSRAGPWGGSRLATRLITSRCFLLKKTTKKPSDAMTCRGDGLVQCIFVFRFETELRVSSLNIPYKMIPSVENVTLLSMWS